MNSFSDSLNQQGGHFLKFAWPMLWQSSLLIALVLAVDLSLARKIRAAVRHALWLVVLVKLLLPPTLALPTGAVWWLLPAKTPVKAPAPGNFVVTYENTIPLPTLIPPTVPLAAPPPARLNRAGWTLLAAGAVSAGLLLWLLCRWAQVVRLVRRATQSDGFSGPIREARRLAGLRGPLRVRITDDRMSPAVCGLFRPIILLPRMLAENLSARQLRAVLLHEAIHIRRGDIWVNCAQALLQVAYWWHPLVWLANARIRRVREEAVDDAVMLALAAEAEIYAPTLLEVARLGLRRPLLSLGLVGILESRSALRQRIERLLAFRAPRKAGVTFASFCGLCMFSAVALPMGQGPARVDKDMAADASPPPRGMTPPTTVPHTNLPAVLVAAEIYEMPMEELKKLVTGLQFNPGQAGGDGWWPASPEEFSELQSALKKSGQIPLQQSRIQISSGKPAQFIVGHDPYRPELDCLLMVNGTQVELSAEEEIVDWAADVALTNRFKVNNALMPIHGGMVIRMQNGASEAVVCLSVEILTNGPAAQFQFSGSSQEIMDKLGKIRLRNVSYDGLPLKEVLKQLSGQCKLLDPEHKGVNFLINNNPDVSSFIIKLPRLTDVRLADVLDAVVRGADQPIQYSVKDFAVVFSAKSAGSPRLSMRTFRIDPSALRVAMDNMRAQTGPVTNALDSHSSVAATARDFFLQSGVNWASPPGKSVFFNDRLGILFVKATENDLDTIERALQALNQVPSQVHLKARFVEVSPSDSELGFDWYLGQFLASGTAGSTTAPAIGILTDPNFQAVWHDLQYRTGVEILGEPEIITFSGRQTQMKVRTQHNYIGDFPPYHNGDPRNEGHDGPPGAWP